MWSRTRDILPFSPPVRLHWPRPVQRSARMRRASTAAHSTSSWIRMCWRFSVRSSAIDKFQAAPTTSRPVLGGRIQVYDLTAMSPARTSIAIGPLRTRTATIADAAAIAEIYNQGIADRIATFETEPRSARDIAEWFTGEHLAVVAKTGET